MDRREEETYYVPILVGIACLVVGFLLGFMASSMMQSNIVESMNDTYNAELDKMAKQGSAPPLVLDARPKVLKSVLGSTSSYSGDVML